MGHAAEIRARLLAVCVTASALSGCATPPVDAATDARLDPPCLSGDPHPWWCVPPGSTGPICGDVRFNPTCVDGAWECGTFGGLVPDRDHVCQCFTGPLPGSTCVCTDGGLECSENDAGATRSDAP